MYKFDVRSGFGRELAAHQLRQHKISQVSSSSSKFSGYFLFSFLDKNKRIGQVALALLTGCVVSILAGCGGVTYNASSRALSAISCAKKSLTGAQSTVCSVNLSAVAKDSTTVTLSSSDAALNVPTLVVVPAGANNVGFNAISEAVSNAVNVTITAASGRVTATDVITLNPVAAPTPGPNPAPVGTLSKISCAKQTLTGPTTTACSVYLSAAAASQTAVTLSSSNNALRAPTSVNVPVGETSAGFSVTASAVSNTQTATLTATADGVSQMNAITLSPSSSAPSPTSVATLSKLSCASQALTGPTSMQCSVYLSSAATSQTVVTLSSNNNALQPPASVKVPAGATAAAFNVTASSLSAKQTALLTATLNGISQMDAITLNSATSATPAAAAALSNLSCATQTLTGPTYMECSVYLSAAATSQTAVTLVSNNKALQAPPTVNVAAGTTAAAFKVTTSALDTKQTVMLTATANGVSQSEAITLNPATTSSVATLSRLSCATQKIIAPATTTCSVSLNTTASGQTVVTLSSNNKALQSPASVNIAAGSTSATFTVTASALTTSQQATLTASANGSSLTDVIQLETATAEAQHAVQLSWNAPNPTSDPVVGYHVYRATSGGSDYVLLAPEPDTKTNYDDTTVKSGTTYQYIVKSVDSDGVESAASNSTSVTVP